MQQRTLADTCCYAMRMFLTVGWSKMDICCWISMPFPSGSWKFPISRRRRSSKLGFSDGIYNRSRGGIAPSGWTCDHLPYLVEFDNYGVSKQPGQARADGGQFNWVWGYDEITWFADQNKEYRADWLRYAWHWVRTTDPNGYLEMPGSRQITKGHIGSQVEVRRNLTPEEGRGITPITQVLLSPMGWEMKRPFAPSGPLIQLRILHP